MSRVVDFDAIRAETEPDEPLELRVGEQTLLLRPEMPFDAVNAWNSEQIDEAISMLVIEPDHAPALRGAIFGDRPSWRVATRRLNAIYKQDPGEPPAS